MTTTNNRNNNLGILCSLNITDPDKFEAYCLGYDDGDQADFIKKYFGMTTADAYEQAKEVLALTMQSDGVPRDYALELAKTGLYELTVTKVDWANICFNHVFLAARTRPQDFMNEWGLLIAEGEILATPVEL